MLMDNMFWGSFFFCLEFSFALAVLELCGVRVRNWRLCLF